MVNLLLNWIIKIKSSSNRFRSSKGFTLMELLIAASLTLIVVGGAGWALVTMLTFNKSDKTTAEVESNYNRALAFIVEELKSSKEIYDDGNLAADVNNNDIAPSFPKEAWKIPILAFQAADNIKDGNEYTVYYLVDKNHPNTPDSAKVWAGDYVLYRWGPPYNDDGQYSPDNTNPDEIKAASTWQGAALVDLVLGSWSEVDPNKPSKRAKKQGCRRPWTRYPDDDADLKGFFICVPQSTDPLAGRLVELHLLGQVEAKGDQNVGLGESVVYEVVTEAFLIATPPTP